MLAVAVLVILAGAGSAQIGDNDANDSDGSLPGQLGSDGRGDGGDVALGVYRDPWAPGGRWVGADGDLGAGGAQGPQQHGRSDVAEPDAPTPEPTTGPAPAKAGADAVEERAQPDLAADGTGGQAVDVWITFYTCPPYCGDPAGPLPLGEGQAACDPAYMGRRFALNGADYVCNDTGSAVWGAHVDLFFWSAADGWAYLARYGTSGMLTWPQ